MTTKIINNYDNHKNYQIMLINLQRIWHITYVCVNNKKM